MSGIVYAPVAAASLSAQRLIGSVFASSVALSGGTHVTRTSDDRAPQITITAPTAGATVPDPAHVLVKGTVTDGETAVTVQVNGQTAAIAADGSYQVTLDLSGKPSPVLITAIATDAAGNTASAQVSVVTLAPPPVVSLTAPVPGSFVATRFVDLAGSAGTATSLTVNGQTALIAAGAWSLPHFDLGADGAHALSITGSNAGGSSTITPSITSDTVAPVVQAAIAPAANAAGWNRATATVTFTCTDVTSGIVTCPAPVAVSNDTAGQVVSGTATDRAGNSGNAVLTVKLDKTAPTIVITTPTTGTSVTASTIAISGTVSDTLAGVASVTCNGEPSTVIGGTFSCNATLVAGDNSLSITATDVAGNSSIVTSHVTYNRLTALAVLPAHATLAVGGTQQLVAQATLTDGTTRDSSTEATWATSDPSLLIVDAHGLATALHYGSVTVSATVNSLTATAGLDVQPNVLSQYCTSRSCPYSGRKPATHRPRHLLRWLVR
ncbi:MAG: Ig-like domain-containing protein [Acidobacteriota bacterium]